MGRLAVRIYFLQNYQWNISILLYRAPYLVVLKDRGKTLRFYRPRHLRLQEDALLEFLKTDGWKATPPWSSSYAPGGSK